MLAFCLYFFNRKIIILLVLPNQKKGAPEDRGVYKDIELLIVISVVILTVISIGYFV